MSEKETTLVEIDMAEDEERNHSTFSKTKTIPGIQSAKEPAHLKCESALDAQQGILEQDSDSNLLMNLSLAESHIPSLETHKEWVDKPIAFQTGDLTLKITKSTVPLDYVNVLKQKTNCRKKKKHRKEIRTNVVTIDGPSNNCSICKEDFNIIDSVYCLKTGNVKIFCRQCATVTSMCGTLKVSLNP